MKIVTRVPNPPTELLIAIERCKLRYTCAKTLFHLVWLWSEDCCGVVGDGDNGSYEWFLWRNGEIKTSDVGYGSDGGALRDILTKEDV